MTAAKNFNRVSSVAQMRGTAEHDQRRGRRAVDQMFLDQVARRLAIDAGLPLPLARKRVEQFSISRRR